MEMKRDSFVLRLGTLFSASRGSRVKCVVHEKVRLESPDSQSSENTRWLRIMAHEAAHHELASVKVIELQEREDEK